MSKDDSSSSQIEKTIEDIHVFNKQYKMRADILKIPKASKIAKIRKQKQGREEDSESAISLEIAPIF
jgi:hypothetical protein